MIIYIAGPITGQFDFMERFAKAERQLKRKGHIVINPARLTQGLKDYMPTCKALIDQADAVFFLHDWAESEGAVEEHLYADTKNKQLIFENPPIDFWVDKMNSIFSKSIFPINLQKNPPKGLEKVGVKNET